MMRVVAKEETFEAFSDEIKGGWVLTSNITGVKRFFADEDFKMRFRELVVIDETKPTEQQQEGRVMLVSELRGLTANVLAVGEVRFMVDGREVFYQKIEKTIPTKTVNGVKMPNGIPTLTIVLASVDTRESPPPIADSTV